MERVYLDDCGTGVDALGTAMTMGGTTVILVRHGQTEWNRVERFRGRADIPLNEVGIEQANAVASRLSRLEQVETVYSSPLTRCLQTAKRIASACGSRLEELQDLVDIDYGHWQGLTPAQTDKRFPDLYRSWLVTPHLTAIPNGETIDQVRVRAVAALEKLTDEYTGRTFVLVSHKVVCKVLMCAVLGVSNASFWQIEQDNAAVNIFERRDGMYYVKAANDVCHLEDDRHYVRITG